MMPCWVSIDSFRGAWLVEKKSGNGEVWGSK